MKTQQLKSLLNGNSQQFFGSNIMARILNKLPVKKPENKEEELSGKYRKKTYLKEKINNHLPSFNKLF